MKTLTIPLALSLIGTVALAHGGVENPAVLARMDGMKSISEQMKMLSETLKGQRDFDAETLNAAVARIESEAAKVVLLFEAPESDPKSEALPAIWQDFAGFTEDAEALMSASAAWTGQIDSPDALQSAVMDLGVTCKACHDAYRE